MPRETFLERVVQPMSQSEQRKKERKIKPNQTKPDTCVMRIEAGLLKSVKVASTDAQSLSFKPICHLPTAQWLDRQLTESRFAIGEFVYTGCYESDFCFNWAKSLFVSQM